MNGTNSTHIILGRIIGEAGAKPILQWLNPESANPTPAVRFQVGVDRPRAGGGQWTEMHTVQVTGDNATMLSERGVAGSSIEVIGEVRNDQGRDLINEHGQTERIYTSATHARVVEWLGSRERPQSAPNLVSDPDAAIQEGADDPATVAAKANAAAAAPAPQAPAIVAGANTVQGGAAAAGRSRQGSPAAARQPAQAPGALTNS